MGFGEVKRQGLKQASEGLVGNQQRDHRQDNGAGESGEVAELAGSESETRIIHVPARVGIGERREQERSGMRAHVQPVGDEGD
jgi:hypothetical protein